MWFWLCCFFHCPSNFLYLLALLVLFFSPSPPLATLRKSIAAKNVLHPIYFTSLMSGECKMSTKSCDLLGMLSGMTSSCSMGVKLCIHLCSETSIFGREMISHSSLKNSRCASYARQLWVTGFWNKAFFCLFVCLLFFSRVIQVPTVSVYLKEYEDEDQGNIWFIRTRHFCLAEAC